ncbi:MAG: cytochrome c [Saprospiraceae bacterium]|nr:cytochrome c [Saprospiraceae bacterium]
MTIYNHLSIKLTAVLPIIGIAGFTSAQVSADAGKDLFKANCAACHSKDMRSAATGPALGGSQAKWGDDVALYGWVRNSQAMVAKGHPRAVEVWNQYKPTVMTPFPNLTDDQIGSIFAYVNGVYDGTYGPKKMLRQQAAKLQSQ